MRLRLSRLAIMWVALVLLGIGKDAALLVRSAAERFLWFDLPGFLLAELLRIDEIEVCAAPPSGLLLAFYRPSLT